MSATATSAVFTSLLALPLPASDSNSPPAAFSLQTYSPLSHLALGPLDPSVVSLVKQSDLSALKPFLDSLDPARYATCVPQLVGLSCLEHNLPVFEFLLTQAQPPIDYNDAYHAVITTDFVAGYQALLVHPDFHHALSQQVSLLMNLEFSPRLAWHLYDQHGPGLFGSSPNVYGAELLIRGWLALLSAGSSEALRHGPIVIAHLRKQIGDDDFNRAIDSTWNYLIELDQPENLVNLINLHCLPDTSVKDFTNFVSADVFLTAIMKSSFRCLNWFAQVPELITQAQRAWKDTSYDRFFFRSHHIMNTLTNLQKYHFDLLAINQAGDNWFHGYCAFEAPDRTMVAWLVKHVPAIFDLPNAKGQTPLQCLANEEIYRSLKTSVDQQLLHQALPLGSSNKPSKPFL